MGQFMLYGERPRLCVGCFVISIHTVRVQQILTRNGAQKSVGYRQHVRNTRDDIIRNRERRLLREPESKRSVGLPVVIDAITPSDDGGAFNPRYLPGKTH